MRKGKSEPIAPGVVGIYRDGTGVRVVAKVNGRQYEKRAPDGDVNRLVQNRAVWIAELRARGSSAKGSLSAAVGQHLSTLPANSTRRNNAEWNLEPWKGRKLKDLQLIQEKNRIEPIPDTLGDLPLKKITTVLISGILAKWRAEGYAASTINHRRQELSNLFVTVNGRSGANPVRDTARIPEVYDEPRGFPQVIVRLILKQMPLGPHKRRLRVLATTGLPPAQIVRLQRHDFDAKAGTLFVRPRRKGAGVKGKTLPLTARAITALRDYFATPIKGWSQVRTREVFKAAVDAARATWNKCRPDEPWPAPRDLVVYDLRHAFLTYAYKTTRDLAAVAELGLHADMKTTKRYAEAAVTETARKAIDQMK